MTFIPQQLPLLLRVFLRKLNQLRKYKKKCTGDKEKDGEKKQMILRICYDAFEQTGSHSAQQMHLDGLPESSSSSERMESENGYELSQQHSKILF